MNWPHKSHEGTQRVVKGQEKLPWCFCQILLLRSLEVPFIPLPRHCLMVFIFLSLIFPKDEEQNTPSQTKRNLQLQFNYFLKGCPAVRSWSVLYFCGLYSLQVQGERRADSIHEKVEKLVHLPLVYILQRFFSLFHEF